MAPAEVLRVLEELDVVGAHIEDDRQGAGGIYPADEDVQRKLADRDAHPADALIAEAEDALAVGHHDHVRIAVGSVVDHLGQPVAVRIGHEEPPWPPVDLAESFAGHPDGRGVDDRHRLGDVVAQDPVEEGLVAVLQRAEIDVLVEIVSPRGELVPAVFNLLVEGLLRRWQQTQQPVSLALLAGERGALGGQRIEQLRLSLQFLGHDFPSAVLCEDSTLAG